MRDARPKRCRVRFPPSSSADWKRSKTLAAPSPLWTSPSRAPNAWSGYFGSFRARSKMWRPTIATSMNRSPPWFPPSNTRLPPLERGRPGVPLSPSPAHRPTRSNAGSSRSSRESGCWRDRSRRSAFGEPTGCNARPSRPFGSRTVPCAGRRAELSAGRDERSGGK